MLDALSSGLTGPQARTLTSILAMRDSRDEVFKSQFVIGQEAAVGDVGDAIQALTPWVEVKHQGSWLAMMPSTYLVKRSSPPTCRLSIEVLMRGDDRLPTLPLGHDAFRHPSPLSAASGLAIWLVLTEGPWKVAHLQEALVISEKTMRRWARSLADAGLITRGHGTIASVLDPKEWGPFLDKAAEAAGTVGMAKDALDKMLASRAKSEAKRVELAAKKSMAADRSRRLGLTEREFEEGLADLLDDGPDRRVVQSQETAETYDAAMRRWLHSVEPYPYIRAFHDVIEHPYMGHWDMANACASMLASIRVTPGAVETYESYWNDFQGKQIPAGESPCPLLWEIQTLYRQYFLWGRDQAKAQSILDRATAVAEPLTDPRKPSHRSDFTEFPRSVYETPAWAVS